MFNQDKRGREKKKKEREEDGEKGWRKMLQGEDVMFKVKEEETFRPEKIGLIDCSVESLALQQFAK